MACTSKKCASTQLTDEQKTILTAMAAQSSPLACKEIAEASGMDSKSVNCKLKGLKDKGFIDSPVRCKYSITDAGRSIMAHD